MAPSGSAGSGTAATSAEMAAARSKRLQFSFFHRRIGGNQEPRTGSSVAVKLKRSLKSFFAAVSLAVIVMVPAPAWLSRAAGADNWRTYHNDRYGTTVDYPDIFKPGPPPDSDDGRKFKSADGADFAVYASYNALDFDLAKFQKFIETNLDPGSVITYRSHGDDWFVISGTRGSDIFYERHLLSHGKQMTESFVITYPARLQQTYDPIVTRMSKSFRPGTGFQTPNKP
jgi:hypothetical protein